MAPFLYFVIMIIFFNVPSNLFFRYLSLNIFVKLCYFVVCSNINQLDLKKTLSDKIDFEEVKQNKFNFSKFW